MATQRILKAAIWFFSSPLLVFSKYMKLASSDFKTDLELCLQSIDQNTISIPPAFINALVVAEDHRNELHLGVDPIAVLRALIVRIQTGQIQGASTIEQQFVRVVTEHYQRTISRKIREQALAVALVQSRSKNAIASTYLSKAFYGSSSVGIDGLRAHFGPELYNATEEQALAFVAQLKYPRPLNPKADWRAKINTRVELLTKRNHKFRGQYTFFHNMKRGRY